LLELNVPVRGFVNLFANGSLIAEESLASEPPTLAESAAVDLDGSHCGPIQRNWIANVLAAS